MMMMTVVMGLDDLENKRGDQMNMAMVGLSTVKNYKLLWYSIFCILVIDIYVICIFLLPDCCLAPLYIYIQTSNQKQNCSKWRIFGLFIKIYCSRLWIIVDLQKEDKFS